MKFQSSDSSTPDISYTYSGDCSDYLKPEKCSLKSWGVKLTIDDTDSGIVLIYLYEIETHTFIHYVKCSYNQNVFTNSEQPEFNSCKDLKLNNFFILKGLLKIKSRPGILQLENEFIVGTRGEVKAEYTASCCSTKLEVDATNTEGGTNSKVIDVEKSKQKSLQL
jgi:hypothetical protein